MGQTVVFTVSTDSDDVAIDSTEARPPRHPFRDAAGVAVRDRRWHIAFALAFAVPALVAAIAFARTGGPWVTTSLVAAAALVTPASGAWAAARRHDGPRGPRAAVVGLAGALLALAQVPAIAWAARAEAWGESGLAPTLSVLALAGSAGALLGFALSLWRGRSGAWLAPLAAMAIALVPIGLYAALVPTATVTESITDLAFTPAGDVGHPIFVCTEREVEATRSHTELIAWIAFGSPVAWAIDAAAFSVPQLANAGDGTLAQAQAWTRSTRVGPDSFTGHCYAPTSLGVPPAVREARYEGAAPLGVNVATAALIAAIAAAAFTSRQVRSGSASR